MIILSTVDESCNFALLLLPIQKFSEAFQPLPNLVILVSQYGNNDERYKNEYRSYLTLTISNF